MRAILYSLLLILGFAIPSVSMAATQDGGICPRPNEGSEVKPPPDLFSQNGTLSVALNFYTSMDDAGRTLFCFVTADGLESPTLHVKPGDTINIALTNMLPDAPGARADVMFAKGDVCGSGIMTVTSVNMHFHGTNVLPKCHSDETIHTIVNAGQSFTYKLHIPKDEPPGLYWYHPHLHGYSSMEVQGGATGAIEVEGIADIQPVVAGLPERYLVLRDQQQITPPSLSASAPPNWDVSVNYVPVTFPQYVPSIVKMKAGAKEFWRVVNASANTIMHLQVTYDGVAQPLGIVAWDGVPTGSKDGTQKGSVITQNDILLPVAGRVEFIIDAPKSGATVALLKTLAIDGGPSGDNNPERTLARIVTTGTPAKLPALALSGNGSRKLRFDDLAIAPVTAKRDLYFSEYVLTHLPRGPHVDDAQIVHFYITVKGQKEIPFDPRNPPAIITNQGAVEEWTIQNRTDEVHEFHIHQVHFLVEEINGVKIPKGQQQLYDTFQVPYWHKEDGKPYPYIKIKLDFRGPTVGDFVYHCHILDHEDQGMMAIIRVLPKAKGGTGQSSARNSVPAHGLAKSQRVTLAAAR